MGFRESLLVKFAILLGLFALTITSGLGVSMVFSGIRERQITGPFRAMTCALNDLSRLEQHIAMLERAVGHAGLEGAVAPFEPGAAAALESLDRTIEFARGSEEIESTIGVSALRQLLRLIETASSTSRESLARPHDAEAKVAALHALGGVRDFVHVIESSVLIDASRAVEFGEEMRRAQMFALRVGLLCSVLIGALALLLLRRWVTTPVARLREATERFASGDLAHRAPVSGVDEIAGLTAQVNTMAEAIGQMQEREVERERLAAVGEMVRRLAHNIRNPISGIRNLAELTRMRSADEGAVREMQTEIIHAVDRFNLWLRELLDVTSPLTLRLDTHEVGHWIDGVVGVVRPLATMHEVEVVVRVDDASLRAEFDAQRLEHALVAVLTNAIQASPLGGRVEVVVSRVREDSFSSRAWEIEVLDEGDGVPDEIKDLVFRPYFTTKPDGNGIGLAIAKQIVAGHNGWIELLTRSARGSRCVVRIPAEPRAQSEPKPMAERGHTADLSRRERVNRGEHSGHRRRAELTRHDPSGP